MTSFKDIYGLLQLSALARNQNRNSQVRSTSSAFSISFGWDAPFIADPYEYFYEQLWNVPLEPALMHDPITKGQL